MKKTIKFFALLALTALLLNSCSKKEEPAEPATLASKLEATAWIREKTEGREKGKEWKESDNVPNCMQFTDAANIMSLSDINTYKVNETAQTLTFGDADEIPFSVTVEGDKLVWEGPFLFGEIRETYKRIPRPKPEMLIGKWVLVKVEKFNLTEYKWEKGPGGSEPMEIKTLTTGTWYGQINYTLKVNVIKIEGDKENRFIIELTNEKLVWIERNVSLGILRYEWKKQK